MDSLTIHHHRSQPQVHNEDTFFTKTLLRTYNTNYDEEIQIKSKRRRSRWRRWFCRDKEDIYHQSTKDREEQPQLDNISLKNVRDEVHDLQTKERTYRSFRRRLFGLKKESPAQTLNLPSVVDVNETLTQRYMNSNYDKLMEDVDAIPFSLRVEEPITVISRVSKLFSLWSSSKSNQQDLDSSPHFTHFAGTEDEEWNPYNVAKKQCLPNLKFATETSACSTNRTGIDRSSRFGSIRRRITQVVSCRKKGYKAEEECHEEEFADDNLSDIDEQSGTVLIHPQSQISTSTTLFIQDFFESPAIFDSKFKPIKTLESDNTYSGSTRISKASEEQSIFKVSDYARENEVNIFKRPERATSIVLEPSVKRIDTPVIESKFFTASESDVSKTVTTNGRSRLLALLNKYSISTPASGTSYELEDRSYIRIHSKTETDIPAKVLQSATVELPINPYPCSSGFQDLEQGERDSRQIEELREMIRENQEYHNRVVKCLPVTT
jgi:hypothetical protein